MSKHTMMAQTVKSTQADVFGSGFDSRSTYDACHALNIYERRRRALSDLQYAWNARNRRAFVVVARDVVAAFGQYNIHALDLYAAALTFAYPQESTHRQILRASCTVPKLLDELLYELARWAYDHSIGVSSSPWS